jgi:hypothetical protein
MVANPQRYLVEIFADPNTRQTDISKLQPKARAEWLAEMTA